MTARIESSLSRGRRSLGRALSLAAAAMWAGTGCASAEPAREAPRESVGEVAAALVGYDCTLVQDTGYSSGKPSPITLVHVDGMPVELSTANAFLTMAQAAENDGVKLHITSGFRTMAEQTYLYGCYTNCNCNNCNLAAKPGYSNHQSGHALDLNSSSGGVLAWLNAHGGSFGWARTVPSEAWHWEWWGGGPTPTPYCTVEKPPIGWLDSADCTSVAGWAQDPDAPDQPIDVHFYFDATSGQPGAVPVVVPAGQHRSDLCQALGSCNHGFSTSSPRSLLDGKPHFVNAFGIDAMGGTNPALSGNPKTFTCAPPAMPVDALHGIKRWLSSPTVFGAWHFDAFRDVAHEPDALVASYPDGPDVPPAPTVVRADDGTPSVWLIDTGVRRHVVDPASLAAWRLDAAVTIQPAAMVYQYPVGADFPELPFVFSSVSSPKAYFLDVPLSPGSGGKGGSGTGGSATGGSAMGGSGKGGSAKGGASTTTGKGGAGGAGSNGSGAAGTGGSGLGTGTSGGVGSTVEEAPGSASGCAATRGSPGAWPAALVLALAAGARRRRRVAAT